MGGEGCSQTLQVTLQRHVGAALLNGLHLQPLDGQLHVLDVLAQNGVLLLQFRRLLSKLAQLIFTSYLEGRNCFI